MGYKRVLRYAGGFHEWKATYPKRVDGTVEKQHVLVVGDTFPDCRVAVLNGDKDRDYLGLPEDARWLSLSDLSTQFVLIQLYNTMCHDCVKETKLMTRFFERVEADPVLSGNLKIIGLGIYDSNADVMRFKKHYDVLYPLFSDRHGQIFECLGQAQLPLAYLLKSQGDGTWEIELIRRGYFEPDDNFLHTLKLAVSQADGAD